MTSDQITDTEVLAVFDGSPMAHEPLTANEIAEMLECPRQTASKKLDELAEYGDVKSKEVGDRNRVWWRPAPLDSSSNRTTVRTHDPPDDDIETTTVTAQGPFSAATPRKRLEAELKRNERPYRTLAENFPNGIVTLFDPDLVYTLAAGQAFDGIPVAPEDIEGKHLREVWNEATANALEPVFEAALDGEHRSVELEYAGREWVVHAVPITDERDDVFAGMTMAQDITEQKERERYLRDAKSQLEAAAEAGAVGTWEWHIPEDQMVTGTSFAKTFEVDPDAAREGVSLDQYISAIHEADRERVKRAVEAAVDSCGEYEEEYRVWDADGELRWVVARGHVECDENGNPVTFPGALTDITERKRAERERDEHRKQLETLFEVLPVGVVVAANDGEHIEANDTAKEIWGGNVFNAENVADYERYSGRWTDTGEPVAPDEWTMARVLQNEEVTEPDVYEIEAVDGERRIVMVHGMPIRDETGDVTRGVITQTDITERRKYQRRLEETVEKLEQSNERLESFASTLAHELRNPVMIGQMYCNELPDEADSEAVGHIAEALDRIERMIDVMLALTRGHEAVGERAPVDLPDVARKAWDEVDAPDATVDVAIDRTVHVDETYVEHLFRNLFENAVEHGGPDVAITVGDLPSGFFVADDGPGIPVDDRDDVFKLGFSTTVERGGTGIGLAFVKRLADVYEWDCRVTESESGGARFEFTNVDHGSSQR